MIVVTPVAHEASKDIDIIVAAKISMTENTLRILINILKLDDRIDKFPDINSHSFNMLEHS